MERAWCGREVRVGLGGGEMERAKREKETEKEEREHRRETGQGGKVQSRRNTKKGAGCRRRRPRSD